MHDMFRSISLLEKALDASWLRNEVISDNIANVDTPNYKKKTVEFEKYLSEALEKSNFRGYRTHEKHIPIGEANLDTVPIRVSQDYSGNQMRLDGNNVDIDAEMSALAKNSIHYNALMNQVSKQMSMLKTVIREIK